MDCRNVSDVNVSGDAKCDQFTRMQINTSFTHYRSVSYFEAISNLTSSSSCKSKLSVMCGSDHHLKPQTVALSSSTPATPRKIESERFSTLHAPSMCNASAGVPRKSRSTSLSNFFARLRPKFHRSAIDMKNPWIVIEFSPQKQDNVSCDGGSDKSDHSFELAARTKAQHFTSLKDLNESDSCKCILSAVSGNRRPLSGSDFLDRRHIVDSRNKPKTKSQNEICSRYRSENSVFFRLSPKRRFERIRRALKNLARKNKYRKCSSASCLDSRSTQFSKDTCDRSFDEGFSRDQRSYICQLENDASPQSALSYTTKPNTCQKSTNYLRVPFSRSFDTKLTSSTESSLRPVSLSLAGEGFYGSTSHAERIRAKMASVESIGSCSLDFDASEPVENGKAQYTTASEFTLQSERLLPSVNGSAGSDDGRKSKKADDRRFRTELIVNNGVSEKDGVFMSNGHSKEKRTEYTVAEIKLPSYVSISCAINGYTSYSRFCRSRDNSPARALRKSSLESSHIYDKTTESVASNVRCSRSYSDCNGNAQTVFTESRHVNISKQLQIPLHSPKEYTTEIVINNRQSPSVVESLQQTKPPMNGHMSEKFLLAREVGNGTKSLVQQRIESLYGVSAEEKAKFPSRTSRPPGGQASRPAKSASVAKRSPSCPPEILKSQIDSKLPVFRHLRKDFREQLLLEDSASGKQTPMCKVTRSVSKGRADIAEEKQDETVFAPDYSNAESHGFSSLPTDVGVDECDRSTIRSPPVVDLPSELQPSLKPCSEEQVQNERPGHKFLFVMESCKAEIEEQIRKWEKELHDSIPEEASGKIRAACGKANLLLSQKFEQFRGLCVKNIEEDPDAPYYTTGSDLQGFWDMVMLQVKDVKETFDDLQAVKENNWQEIKKETAAVQVRPRKSTGAVSKSNPCTPKRGAKSAELAKAREEARKQLLAAKRKGRQQNANVTDSDVSIFTSS